MSIKRRLAGISYIVVLALSVPAYAQSYGQGCGYCEYIYQNAKYECYSRYVGDVSCYARAEYNFNVCKQTRGCRG